MNTRKPPARFLGATALAAAALTGTLRVWLFREVGNTPKEKVVDSVVAAFEKAHAGTEGDVEYIPVETRAQRAKAAFNDPSSAPDVIEYGNTDTAGHVKDGGLLDVTEEFGAWREAKDPDPTAEGSVTVDGRVYGAPFCVGVRALYYRTDVFDKLGLQVPKTMAELASTARRIRAAEPELYGFVVGGAYTYGALPFVWAHGREIATGRGGARLGDRQRGRPEGHQGVHVPLHRRKLPGVLVCGHGRQRHGHRVRRGQGGHGDRR
jgi:N,N'-diacetylchitobiose transport system substrate-binding protein